MPGIIVSDTSCLILLDKIERLDLLKDLFGKITITSVIAEEYGFNIPDFITIENPKDKNYQKILESFLDPGEASALALALEKDECLLIIDDNKGRREAKQLGLIYTGTLGLFVLAKEKGLLTDIDDLLNKIRKTDFRISQKLLDEVRKKADNY